MSDFINEFANTLIFNKLATEHNIVGCSSAEIDIIEQIFDIRLPELYKNFLQKMGHQAGRFGQGTDMFYQHLIDNQEGFQELLQEDEVVFELDKNFFVISSHQGYIYHFFDIVEDLIDPPIYGYMEGDFKVKQTNSRFSDFLLGNLKEELSL